MTKREAAIISAYTGILIGEVGEMQRYAEEVLQRPVFTHHMANKAFWDELSNKAREDLVTIVVE